MANDPHPSDRSENGSRSGDPPADAGESTPAGPGPGTPAERPTFQQPTGRGADGPPTEAWPPTSGSPADDSPAAADQPTPQQLRPGQPIEGQPIEGQPTAQWPQVGGGDTEAQDPWLGQDETVIRPATGDETRSLPPLDPDATALSPGQGEPNDPTQRWAARAGVPPAGARRRPVQQEWVPVEEARGGAWWMPVLISIIVLILLALLGLGLWLALRGNNSPSPVPVSPSPGPASAAPSPTPSPTPQPSASASASPALVALPSLRGVAVEDAQRLLGDMGLTAAVQTEVDSSLPPGTVLRTVPDAGAMVAPGSQVLLIVAASPPPSPTTEPGAPTDTSAPSPSGP